MILIRFLNVVNLLPRMVKNISDGISNFTPKPRFNKGSSTTDGPTPPSSGKSWLDAYRENPNYSPTGYR